MLVVTIPGTMRGKGRPRFTNAGGFGRAYTDAATANAETWVRSCAIDQVGRPILAGPVALMMQIDIVPPASWSKKQRTAALAGGTFPTGKPDLDNCLKLVADALNGILWQDDKQIVRVVATKVFAEVAQTTLRVTSA